MLWCTRYWGFWWRGFLPTIRRQATRFLTLYTHPTWVGPGKGSSRSKNSVMSRQSLIIIRLYRNVYRQHLHVQPMKCALVKKHVFNSCTVRTRQGSPGVFSFHRATCGNIGSLLFYRLKCKLTRPRGVTWEVWHQCSIITIMIISWVSWYRNKRLTYT